MSNPENQHWPLEKRLEGIPEGKGIGEEIQRLAGQAQFLTVDFHGRAARSAYIAGAAALGMLKSFAVDPPAAALHNAVGDVLKDEAARKNTNEQERQGDDLAREVLEDEDKTRRDKFVRVLQGHVRKLHEEVERKVVLPDYPTVNVDGGTLAIDPAVFDPLSREAAAIADEVFARYLETGLGERGGNAAGAVRRGAKKRQADSRQLDTVGREQTGLSWRLWMDLGNAKVGPYPVLYYLAGTAWRHELRPEVKRNLPPSKGELVRYGVHVEVGGVEYVGVGQQVGGMSWAFGGIGEELDGSEYTPQPGFSAAIVSRTWDAIPQRRRERQTPFSFAEDVRAGAELALVVQGRQGRPRKGKHVLSCNAGKLVLVVCASVNTTGRPRWVRAEALAAELAPYAARVQKRDLEQLVDAMWELKPLHLVLPDSRAIQCFDLVAPMDPKRVTREMLLSYAYGPSMFDACFGESPEFPRFFVLNKTAALSIDGKQGPKLRALVRASDMWDRAFDVRSHRFNAEFLPVFDAETWAAEINVLDASDRRLREKARRLVTEDLDALYEAGHVVVQRLRGPGRRFKILPPEAWGQAREAIRKQLQKRHRR